jgi:hypothetical protein
MLVLINNPDSRSHGRLGIAKPFLVDYYEVTFVCRAIINGYYTDVDGIFVESKEMIVVCKDINVG